MIETEQRHVDPFVSAFGANPGTAASSSMANGADANQQQPAPVNFVAYLPRPAYRFKPTLTLNPNEAEGGYGRRLRKNLAQVRRHIDCVASVLNYVENRCWQRDKAPSDRPYIQPHLLYSTDSFPPIYCPENPIDCVTSKFVRSAMNKVKCPIYDVCWTPEGRRLITGASSGEFTLWNGTAFNFETILQAHDSAVRAMKWSHNDAWLMTADHDGFVKYWQTNMNNVTMFQAHKEAVRSLSFCPSDAKFASASDDGTVRVWDFLRCYEERILRGHGSDVRCVDWHPNKALLVSGSRDSQQPVKLWDPKTSQCLATLHDHKNAVMSVQWNSNGNWFISASRDHLIKLYDIRMMKELFSFRGHKKEVTAISWHPVHEGLFVSGGADGAMMFWLVGNEREVGLMETAHEQAVWTLKWHPLGHILASGSNDNNTKFWTRNKPGDLLEDFYSMVSSNPFDQSSGPSSSLVGQQRHHYPSYQSGDHGHISNKIEVSPMKKENPNHHASWPLANRQSTSSTSDELPGIGKTESKPTKGEITPTAAAIPGLGGVELFGSHGSNGPSLPLTQPAGGRKTLLKQPPPKKAQRQFERVWNVSNDRYASEYEEGPSMGDPDYRFGKSFGGEGSRYLDWNNDEDDYRPANKRRNRNRRDRDRERERDPSPPFARPPASQEPSRHQYSSIPPLLQQQPQVMDLLSVPLDLGVGQWETSADSAGMSNWESGKPPVASSVLSQFGIGDVDLRQKSGQQYGGKEPRHHLMSQQQPMVPSASTPSSIPGSHTGPVPLMMTPIPPPPQMINTRDPRQSRSAMNSTANLPPTTIQQANYPGPPQSSMDSSNPYVTTTVPVTSDPRLGSATRDPRSRSSNTLHGAEMMDSYSSGGAGGSVDSPSAGGEMESDGSRSALLNPKRKWKQDYEAEERRWGGDEGPGGGHRPHHSSSHRRQDYEDADWNPQRRPGDRNDNEDIDDRQHNFGRQQRRRHL